MTFIPHRRFRGSGSGDVEVFLCEGAQGLSWDVREFHLRHPDGHTFRVSAGLPVNE